MAGSKHGTSICGVRELGEIVFAIFPILSRYPSGDLGSRVDLCGSGQTYGLISHVYHDIRIAFLSCLQLAMLGSHCPQTTDDDVEHHAPDLQ